MSDRHAPPWKVVPPSAYSDVWTVTTDRGDPAEEYDVFEDPPEWAVRLGAAAPALLAACEEVLDWRENDPGDWPFPGDQIRAAIALAKGGTA